MNKKLITLLILSILAILLTTALTYMTLELPRLISSLLIDKFDFPGYDSGCRIEETETFLNLHHLRLIGYGSLTCILSLIILGLVTEKHSLSSAGAVAFFIPVFGHFAFSMFFLAGLGLLRIVWLPFLDISYDILRLGDVVYVPYMIIVYIPALFGIDIRTHFALFFMGVGILIFISGIIIWFYIRYHGKKVADKSLYRFSRHPQYLGWILWSYGLMIYVSLHSSLYQFKISYGIPTSLPWLVSTLVIVGVAMQEEVGMKQDKEIQYDQYRHKTSFLLPLPRFISRIFSAPMRLILKKGFPESRKEVMLVLCVYMIVFILLSIPFIAFDLPARTGWYAYPYNVFPMSH